MANREYYKGTRERVSLAKESTYGTNPGLDTNAYIPGEDINIQPDFGQGYQETYNTGDTGDREIEAHYPGPRDYPYEINFNPVIWRFLKAAFNHTESENNGVYTHTLTVPDTVQGFTLERFQDNKNNPAIERLLGSFTKTLGISWEAGTPGSQNNKINVNASCNAQSRNEPGTEASLTPLERAPYFSHEAQLTLTGTDIDEIKNFDLNFDFGINENEEGRYASKNVGRDKGQPPVNLLRTSGSFDVNAYDKTWIDTFHNTVADELKIRIEKASDDYLEVIFNDVRITAKPRPTNFENLEPVGIEWVATTINKIEAVDTVSWN